MPLTVLRPRVAEQSRVQGLGSLPKLVPTVLVVAVQFALALLISVAVHALPTIPEAAVLPDEQPHEAAGAAAVD